MLVVQTSGGFGSAREDERLDRFVQGWRQRIILAVSRHERLVVAVRYPGPCVIVVAHQRKRVGAICPSIGVGPEAEDRFGAHVVGRHREADDEAAREQILAFLLSLAPLVDEDVGERRRRVANVGALVEGVEQLPYQAVDLLRVVVGIRLTIVIKRLQAGIN